MRKADPRVLAAQVLILLGAAALPWLVHPLLAAAVLFLTPWLAETLRAAGLRHMGMAMTAVICLSASLAGMPEWTSLLACLWFLAALVMDNLPRVQRRVHRIAGWLVFSAAITGAAMVMLRKHYDGALMHGLALEAIAWIEARPDTNRVLLAAHQLGLCRLEKSMQSMPGVDILGVTMILPQVRTELVNSLRATIEFTLQDALPGWIVIYLGVTGFLAAWLPERVLRRKNQAQLPPMSCWHLPRRMGVSASVLLLFGLVRYMTGNVAVFQAAGMASVAFDLIFGLQGLCLVIWWVRKNPRQPGMGMMLTVLALLMLTALPTALMLLGLYDQFADPRALRAKDDIEGGQNR